MGLSNPDVILFDINGNPYGVSGSMALPNGGIGQLVAGVDGGNVVRYLSTTTAGVVNTTAVIENWPSVIGVSGSLTTTPGATNVYTSGPQGVTGSLNVYTSGLQGISGTVTANAVIQNWPLTIGVSGTVTTTPGPTNVYTSGLQGVSGTVSLSITSSLPVTVGNFPTVQATTTVIQNWPALIGVSGTLTSTPGPTNVYTSGLQGISGTVSAVIQNWPLTIGISGSTNVYTSGLQGVSGTVTANAVIQNWPLTMNVSGTVTAINGPTNVYTSGPQGVTGSLNVYTSGLQGISGTVIANAVIQNWPAIIGVSGSLSGGPTNVYTSGLQGVSGTVTAIGPTLSGSAASSPFPVIFGGVDATGIVRPVRVDPQGRIDNQCTGSNVTNQAASVTNVTLLFPNPNRVGAVIFNEGASTLYAKFGLVASITSYTVQIGAKGYYEVPFTYTGQIDGIFSTAAGNARITELT
jgi:hypothetical protein